MSNKQTSTDIILIGAGIMSATLGAMLKELNPSFNITIFEKLDEAGKESSNVWNNAGTGHSALCEMNYTTENADGSMDIKKALKVNEEFQLSKQFWSYLIQKKLITDPNEFIMPIPHISLVWGEDNVEFLKKRFKALTNNPLFEGMEYTDDEKVLNEWMPLIMNQQEMEDPMAATKVDTGTDVNFGRLTTKLLEHLEEQGVKIHYNSTVEDMKRMDDGAWEVRVRNYEEDTLAFHNSNFVFIGAGGGALPLLQKTGIPESKHIGGFPVSGLFMVCNNPDVIQKHNAKVYGKAKVGAPPMSVPHLDTRYIDGKRSLLFGPFAGFSPKFLKTGSNLDLIGSVKPNNVVTMLAAGAKEMKLTKYLIQQLMLSDEKRMDELREFIPNAKSEDWDIVTAGQRVQVIKDTEGGKGTLQFGTEVITGAEGTIAALLGASPGASTAVQVMIDILSKCFPEHMEEWEPKLKEMVPSYGKTLVDYPELIQEIHTSTAKSLGLEEKLQEV